MFSQTYVLCDENVTVKPTFTNELNQVNTFSDFSIFYKKEKKKKQKNDKKKKKNSQKTTKKIFQLRRNYTDQKEFSLTLRKLYRSPAKFFSDIISLSFIIRIKKIFAREKCFKI